MLKVQSQTLESLSDDVLVAWQTLEARAAEPCAFLSPHFVLPAKKHLAPASPVEAIQIYAGEAKPDKLVGLGVFEYSRGSRLFPLPHLHTRVPP